MNESSDGIGPVTQRATDEALMLQVREGKSEMLGELFDRYQIPLFNFYSKMTGNRSLSEDLVQDVFLRILKYHRSYGEGTPFRTWMYQIARNARFDQMRRQRPETTTETPEMAPPRLMVDPAQSQQEAELLRRALMQLSEEKRELLILSRFQELSHEEIAQLLGCQAGAAKVRVHRALQELREIFRRLECGGASHAV